MSNYTTQVRFICESYAGLDESVGYANVDTVIASARDKVFDFEYPIFDESYRAVLETKILKHYYTREIASETVGLWKLWLNTKMNEIMPYYNELYKSALFDFNPLYDVDYTRTYNKVFDGDNTTDVNESKTVNDSNTTSYNESAEKTEAGNSGDTELNLFSDTPQGAITNVEEADYLTNVTKNTKNNDYDNTINNSINGGSTNTNARSETINTSTGNEINSVEDYVETVKGKQGGVSYSKMVTEFRNTILNVDIMVINELKSLFFLLW